MRNRTRTVIWKAAAALAAVITVGACSGSPQVRSITLTFIRHAESQSNAQHVINTDIPGPSLTEEGQGQAEQLAHQLARNNFDGVYASDMVRTQQTAEPLAHALGKSVEILPGLREIEAGRYNNTTTKRADLTYLVAPADWLNGDVKDAIPGSVSGEQFNDRFTAAVQKIYDSGHNKPVAFSHAESIMYWTLMNVNNPDFSVLLQEVEQTEGFLPNTGQVVIDGSPGDWTLVSYNGVDVPQDPGLGTELFVDFRNLIEAPQFAGYDIYEALLGGNSATIDAALQTGLSQVDTALAQFPVAVFDDIVTALGGTV